MTADHHDLVLLVGAWEISDHVVDRLRLSCEPVVDVELERYRLSLAQKAGDRVEVFSTQADQHFIGQLLEVDARVAAVAPNEIATRAVDASGDTGRIDRLV